MVIYRPKSATMEFIQQWKDPVRRACLASARKRAPIMEDEVMSIFTKPDQYGRYTPGQYYLLDDVLTVVDEEYFFSHGYMPSTIVVTNLKYKLCRDQVAKSIRRLKFYSPDLSNRRVCSAERKRLIDYITTWYYPNTDSYRVPLW